jgi:catechol 2,3-dioxygenase-like lactoylglutathione lyase family enzyme
VAVEGVGFVGLRTDQFSEMVRLFRDVIGMPLARQAVGLAGFRLDDGTVLEIYGPADEYHSFFTTGPVVGLRVGDFDGAREMMLAAGVEFIGAVQHVRGMSWQHFRCPDGTVLEIIGPGTPPPSAPPSVAPDRGRGSESSVPD